MELTALYEKTKKDVKPLFYELHNLPANLSLVSLYDSYTKKLDTKIILSSALRHTKNEILLFKKNGYKELKKEMKDELKDELTEELLDNIFEDVFEDEFLSNILDIGGSGINLLLDHLKEKKPKKGKKFPLSKKLKNLSNKIKLSKYIQVPKELLPKILSVAIFTDKTVKDIEIAKAKEIIDYIYEDSLTRLETKVMVTENIVNYQNDTLLFQTDKELISNKMKDHPDIELYFKDIFLADHYIQPAEEQQIDQYKRREDESNISKRYA